MNASDLAAWWGATLATLVFGWDVYKWKTSGSRLALSVATDMQLAGAPAERLHLFVEVVNRRERLTALTHLAIYQFASKWQRIRHKSKAAALAANPDGGPGVPFELAPGKTMDWHDRSGRDHFAIRGRRGLRRD